MDLKLSCTTCPLKSKANIFTDVSLDIDDTAAKKLESGECFFYFSCHPGPNHTEAQRSLIDKVINLSSFRNEVAENNVPFVNIYDPKDADKYTVIFTQAVYLLPKLTADRINPAFLSSVDYHVNCQPKGSVVIAEECKDNMFRFTKQIIPYLYSLTVQFNVSLLPKESLDLLSAELGVCFTHGILLERTKKNKGKVDSTAKVKSVLLYFPVDGGFLVHNATVVLNTFIPSIVTPIIEAFNHGGAVEVEETVEKTRKFIAKVQQ